MNEMMKRKKDGGFTLIELMIVIAVIGILAVVLVPKMGGIKTSAKLTGVTTNFSTVLAITHGLNNLTGANAGAIATEITTRVGTQFAEMKNPISGGNGVVVVDTLPAAASILPGTVYVVPSITGTVISIQVTGYDDNKLLIPGLTQIVVP